MPRYQVKGVKLSTGRKNTRIYEVNSMEAARAEAEASGLSVLDITELPPEPPTED